MNVHSFNVEIAQKYGVNSAIILYNIEFWIRHNMANNKHFYDGNYWTYNSNKAFQELFPYLSIKQIRLALQKLIDDDIIVVGNYNDSTYDRTSWYALTFKGKSILNFDVDKNECLPDEYDADNNLSRSEVHPHLPLRANGSAPKGKCIEQKGQMDFPSKANGNALRGKPIPYINTYINTDVNTNINRTEEGQSTSVEKKLSDFKKMREDLNRPMSKTQEMALIEYLDSIASSEQEKIEILNYSIIGGYPNIYPVRGRPKIRGDNIDFTSATENISEIEQQFIAVYSK